MQHVYIDLNNRHSFITVVDAFSRISLSNDLTVHVAHAKGSFIAVEIYPVLCSIVNEVRSNGFSVVLDFETPENCNQLSYAERMNFLEALGIDYFTPFGRNKGNGRFMELTNLPAGSYTFPGNLEEIFMQDFNFNQGAAQQLAFIIGEMTCNMTMHSYSKNGAYFYCQKYQSKQFLEIHIVDSGKGIVNSMRNNAEYNGIDDEELLPLALEFGEGSGNGRGHGLYFVTEFLRRNNGFFRILSGHNNVIIRGANQFHNHNPYYEGVILHLKIPFKIRVTTTDLMKEKLYSNV